MATRRQITANRRNGQRSRGPKTAITKLAAARNALKHGLLSKDAMLPGESSTDFFNFCEELNGELNPVGELECTFVGGIGSLLWRLKRIGNFEAGILQWHAAKPEVTAERISFLTRAGYVADRGEAFFRSEDSLAKLSRYETSIERSLHRTLHELQRLQAARRGETVPAPVVVDVDLSSLDETESGE